MPQEPDRLRRLSTWGGWGRLALFPFPQEKVQSFPDSFGKHLLFNLIFNSRYVGGLSKPVDSFKIHKEYDYGREEF